MKTKKFQLKNGLKVLAIESQKSPVVSVQMWVRTGSADEGPEEEGISHFIEHLVFKGSEKYKVGEIAEKVERDGGALNAYTSLDQTVFYVTISSQFLETALDTISQMMGHPIFDAQEIDNEREVVIEEIKRSEDNPHRQASRALFSTVYKKHPYGLPVIGYAKNISQFSREKIVRFYKNRYSPRNMTLLVVGDVDVNQVKSQVAKYFSGIVDSPIKRIKRSREPKQVKAKSRVVTGAFNEKLLHMAWRVPGAKHKDVPALDVLSMVLGQGESSRLMQALRIRKPLTNYSVASAFTPRDEGFFVVSCSLIDGRVEEAFKEVLSQLEKILEEPPTGHELEKVITTLEGDELYSMQTVDGLARKFGTYEDIFQDYKHHWKFLKEVGRIRPEDITRVARKYLKPESMTAVVLTSDRESWYQAKVKSLIADYSKIYKRTKAKKIVPPKWRRPRIMFFKEKEKGRPFIDKVMLSSGAQLILQANHDQPVISLKLAFLGGVRAERPEDQGLTEALSRTWVSNTKELTESQIHHLMDAHASSLSAFGGRNTVGLSLTTLSPVWSQMQGLFKQVLLDARITSEVINRESIHMLEELKKRDDNPAQICAQNFMREMFKSHPYGRDMLGHEAQIKGITEERVYEHLCYMRKSANLNIAVVGDVTREPLIEKLEEITAQLPRGERFEREFDLVLPQTEQRTFHELKKEQTHIIVGYPGLTFTDKDRYALQVIQSVLAGQGGRLFLELRDKKSLAYTVSPLRMEGIDAGYFGAYIACSPEKAQTAIEMLIGEFNKLGEFRVGETELKRAQRFIVGRHDIELQKNSSIASTLLFDDIYGISFKETRSFAQRIMDVDAQQVQTMARRIFSQPKVISVVGQTCPW